MYIPDNLPKIERDILKEVGYLKERYFVKDEPVELNGLTLYPVKVKDYNDFAWASACLTLHKNDVFEGVKMTHLEFLLSKIKKKDEPQWASMFSKIVEICLHIRPGVRCKKCGKYIGYLDFYNQDFFKKCELGLSKEELFKCECGDKLVPSVETGVDEKGKTIVYIDGIKVNADDFNRIRKYLLYQNFPDFKDDSWVHKSVREDQALKADLLSKNSGTASLERKIVCVCSQSCYKIEDIFEMPMRKFIMLLGVINDAIEYKAAKQGVMSGMVTLKKGASLEHWVYRKERGLYDAAVDSGDLTQKIKNL